MSTKPKKIKDLKQQEGQPRPEEAPKKQLGFAKGTGLFFILLYAFGVYTNLKTDNYLMAAVWSVLIIVNIFFILRNHSRK